MALWEYKVITSGKGGFASPALLEKFLNDLGQESLEILHFHTQPDNPLAFTGLARRQTQRDWTLEDAAKAAARAEADKLRLEFEAKFKAATNLNIRWNKHTYVFELVESDTPVLALNLEDRATTETVQPAPFIFKPAPPAITPAAGTVFESPAMPTTIKVTPGVMSATNQINAMYTGKELGLKPIESPLLPVSAAQQAQLQALLAKYKANQITPEEYHSQRAEILAQP